MLEFASACEVLQINNASLNPINVISMFDHRNINFAYIIFQRFSQKSIIVLISFLHSNSFAPSTM